MAGRVGSWKKVKAGLSEVDATEPALQTPGSRAFQEERTVDKTVYSAKLLSWPVFLPFK